MTEQTTSNSPEKVTVVGSDHELLGSSSRVVTALPAVRIGDEFFRARTRTWSSAIPETLEPVRESDIRVRFELDTEELTSATADDGSIVVFVGAHFANEVIRGQIIAEIESSGGEQLVASNALAAPGSLIAIHESRYSEVANSLRCELRRGFKDAVAEALASETSDSVVAASEAFSAIVNSGFSSFEETTYLDVAAALVECDLARVRMMTDATASWFSKTRLIEVLAEHQLLDRWREFEEVDEAANNYVADTKPATELIEEDELSQVHYLSSRSFAETTHLLIDADMIAHSESAIFRYRVVHEDDVEIAQPHSEIEKSTGSANIRSKPGSIGPQSERLERPGLDIRGKKLGN